jgi:hypothetical protein
MERRQRERRRKEKRRKRERHNSDLIFLFRPSLIISIFSLFFSLFLIFPHLLEESIDKDSANAALKANQGRVVFNGQNNAAGMPSP